MKYGLVLEGGGMRGAYTVGVLDEFMERGVSFDYVIGVSAGASNGVSFVSKQKGRSLRINTEYLKDKRYLSLSNYLKSKSLFGMDFIFDEIPHRLEKFDYTAFFQNPCEFYAGVTDIETGKPVYFGKERDICTVLRASSSIPIFSPPVEINGRLYLDGGTSDPIPVKKAVEDGCDRVVVVLTRERSYQKNPEKFRPVYKRVFHQYPQMIHTLDTRHEIYNNELHYLRSLEKEGRALVIAPKESLGIGRFEKEKEKLLSVYRQGRRDAIVNPDFMKDAQPL